jgi:hypothetical protein
MHPSLARLSEFLVDAKRKTYAGLTTTRRFRRRCFRAPSNLDIAPAI